MQTYQERGSFLDCSEKGLNSLILPIRYVSQPFHQIRNSSSCVDWIDLGMGDWVLVGLNSQLEAKVEKQEEWKLYFRSNEDHFSLWKFESPVQ